MIRVTLGALAAKKGSLEFNVAEFPRMSFKAGEVKFDGDNPAEVTRGVRSYRD